jgi:DNA (cytosine-5)-methyltransferase 1
LTAKNKQNDSRNELLLVMGELIEEIRPEAIMMENVPGLADRGKPIFEKFLKALRRLGYHYEWRIEQMANFGIPQSRRRLVLLAGRGFNIAFPAPSHTRSPKPGSELKPWTTVRETIGHMGAPITLSAALANGGPQSRNWHVVRDLQPQTKERLRAAKPGQTWLKIDESVRPRCHRNGYDGFTNVYGRMAWDQVSPTVTGGCTTPCKGRFGHPDKRRYTISVREAALLQTFPENYRFVTDQMDAVCDLIGNAVPPLYAKLAAKEVLASIKKRVHRKDGARQ